jgi:hypothetical protein
VSLDLSRETTQAVLTAVTSELFHLICLSNFNTLGAVKIGNCSFLWNQSVKNYKLQIVKYGSK